MALCLLADEWARKRGGHVVALSVDHGLRPGSADEARQVAMWLADLSIKHQILVWQHNGHVGSGTQEKARRARLGLLTAWCAERGLLHLLLGHHARDQAETILMRRERKRTGDGLAGMSLASDGACVRVLRPLLGVQPETLRGLLERAGVPWLEDPSNDDDRFERVRVRKRLPENFAHVNSSGVTAGKARADADGDTARLLADVFAFRPAGHAWSDRRRLTGYTPPLLARSIARLIRTVGGHRYLPSGEKVRGLVERLLEPTGFAGATLGGCRFLERRGRLLVCREVAAVAPATTLRPGDAIVWDDRFHVELRRDAVPGTYELGALGPHGWRQVRQAVDRRHLKDWPAAARHVAPALWRDGRVVEVPHLTYAMPERHAESGRLLEIEPSFPEPLENGRFFIASVLE